jgi:predicted alpha/beta superfamily hydrolase
LKQFFVTILFAFFGTCLFAQKDSVIFILVDTSGIKTADYFLACNANGWNPADTNYRFKKDNDGTLFLNAFFEKGTQLEFKFTKGSWGKVECSKEGIDISNRKLKTDTAELSVYYISGWKDESNTSLLLHTASSNVSILDTVFYMPQLKRHRRIWLYLPQDYASSKKHYPVIYMHDGQNLFDRLTAFGGNEWGVDEYLDSLTIKQNTACIIVGIENDANRRMNEYNPYEFTWNSETGKKNFLPEGDAYANFIAETLKPFMDKKFRTLSSKDNTVIAGSSMGGLISYYTALKYPQVFGKAGIFSPAFWTAPAIIDYTDSVSAKVSGKFFFYAGSKEGDEMEKNMFAVAEKLGANSSAMIYTLVDTEGRHNETYWQKWFAEFYKWVMADGYNTVTKLDD